MSLTTVIGGIIALTGFIILSPLIFKNDAPSASEQAQQKRREDEGVISTASRILLGDSSIDALNASLEKQQKSVNSVLGSHEDPAKEREARKIIESQLQGSLPNFQFTSPIKVDSAGRIESDTPPLFEIPKDLREQALAEKRKLLALRAQTDKSKGAQTLKSLPPTGTLAHIVKNQGFSNQFESV